MFCSKTSQTRFICHLLTWSLNPIQHPLPLRKLFGGFGDPPPLLEALGPGGKAAAARSAGVRGEREESDHAREGPRGPQGWWWSPGPAVGGIRSASARRWLTPHPGGRAGAAESAGLASAPRGGRGGRVERSERRPGSRPPPGGRSHRSPSVSLTSFELFGTPEQEPMSGESGRGEWVSFCASLQAYITWLSSGLYVGSEAGARAPTPPGGSPLRRPGPGAPTHPQGTAKAPPRHRQGGVGGPGTRALKVGAGRSDGRGPGR